MEIKKKNFFKILGGEKRFVVPLYQRAYAWERPQCERLLDDLIEVGRSAKPQETNHYLGSIIIKKDTGSVEDKKNRYSIVDGQQRITTLSLLLLAFYNHECKFFSSIGNDKEETRHEIKKEYLINPKFENEWNDRAKYLKLNLKSKADSEAYYNLVRHGTLSKNGSRICANYRFFFDAIENRKISFEAVITGIENSPLAEVMLDKDENPQKLFEAVNDTGLGLSQSDLIKNWIFMGIGQDSEDSLYEKYWPTIESNLKDKTESFFWYYVELKSGEIPRNGSYKSFLKAFKDGPRDEELLKDIANYSEIYSDYTNSSFDSKDINTAISNLGEFQKSIFTPVLLKILYQLYIDKTLSEENALLMFRYIESYIVRRDMLRMPSNSLGQAMINIIKYLGSVDELSWALSVKLTRSQRMPTDEELDARLKNEDFYNLKWSKEYLYRIEKHLNESFSLRNPTIEHIMPETMHTNANPKTNVSDPDRYNWEIDLGSDAQRIHDKYVNTIGNLTILPASENSKFSNSRFQIKRNYGYDDPDSFIYGFKNSPIRMSQKLGKNYQKWGEDEILMRAEEIIGYIKEIWPYPKQSKKPDKV